jgi:hypothetical protein
MDEFRQKIQDITFENWQRAHPNGTRAQWDESQRQSETFQRQLDKAREQAAVNRGAYAIIGFGLLVWKYLILPAIAATAICMVFNATWISMYFLSLVLLWVIKKFTGKG